MNDPVKVNADARDSAAYWQAVAEPAPPADDLPATAAVAVVVGGLLGAAPRASARRR